MSGRTLSHEFVDHIPKNLEQGTIYVCIPYATVVHLCACGCGNEVVTPLGPTDWRVSFNGETVSLRPSIGNWSFPCESHYWISDNRVEWARRWSKWEVEAARREDGRIKNGPTEEAASATGASGDVPASPGWLTRLRARFRRK